MIALQHHLKVVLSLADGYRKKKVVLEASIANACSPKWHALSRNYEILGCFLEMERVTLLVGFEGGDVQYDAIAVIKSCYWKILGV